MTTQSAFSMTSDEINDKIGDIDPSALGLILGVEHTPLAPPSLNGAVIVPYMGFYWRAINWDEFVQRGYWFTVSSGTRHFDEAHKWDCPSVHVSGEHCGEYRLLLEIALLNPSQDAFEAANQYLQAVAPSGGQ